MVNILGKEITGLLDSGANCSLLGGKFVELISQLGIRKNILKGELKTADGTEHRVQAYSQVPIAYNNKNEILPVLLLPTLPDCVIFGINFWNTFKIKPVCLALKADINEDKSELTIALSKSQRSVLSETIEKFPVAEEGKLGRTTLYTHRIEIGNAKPRKQRDYPMSKYVLEEVNKEIDRMINLDVIEEAFFSPWNNPLVADKKKTGKYRVCLDARHLNSIMINEGYPIPQMAAIINNLSSCKYISSLDLKDAFWQLPLEES